MQHIIRSSVLHLGREAWTIAKQPRQADIRVLPIHISVPSASVSLRLVVVKNKHKALHAEGEDSAARRHDASDDDAALHGPIRTQTSLSSPGAKLLLGEAILLL